MNWSSSSYNRWVTTQHEVSHLFNDPDRYPDPNNSHTNDVMENQYSYPNFWCEVVPVGLGDHPMFELYADKFD